MNFTEAQIEDMRRGFASRAREVWEVRHATSKWDPYHPDNIRKEIKRLQNLLEEAQC